MCIYTFFKFCYSRNPLLIQGKGQGKVKNSHPSKLKNTHMFIIYVAIDSLYNFCFSKEPLLIQEQSKS